MKKSVNTLLIILLMIPFHESFSQDMVLKLWPSGIPGSIKNDAYVEKPTITNGVPVRFEKVTDPTLSVFFPPAGKESGTAVVICPGGGYSALAFDHEGNAVARWLNENGITAVILKYRLPSDLIMVDKSTGPLQDAQEALRTVRRNASKWKVDPHRIGILGFSAGGHLASTLSTHYNDKVYEPGDTTSARPDFSILIYPVITFDQSFAHMGSRRNLIGESPSEEIIRHFSNEKQVNANTPRAFLVHAADDKGVLPLNSIRYYESLLKFGIPSELHIFQKGGHGFGLAPGKETQGEWPKLCINWLRFSGF